MSETSTVDFNNLKPVIERKLKTFTVVGKELTEKQVKAGYYLSIMDGDNIDGIFNGLMKETNREGKVQTEVEMLGTEGDIIRINASKGLMDQLASIEIGTPVRLSYGGKKKLKNGNSFHNWEVLA